MRIAIDIDEKTLRVVQEATGETRESAAINRALQLYLREVKKRQLIEKVMSRQTDYSTTNEELESRPIFDPD